MGTHADAEFHHHHGHGASSRHPEGHHLLQVEGLSVGFRMYDPEAPYLSAERTVSYAIRDMSISVHPGEIVAVVGASGSGKTLLADAILGLFEPNALVSGKIWFDGKLQDEASLAALRGREVSLVPQSVSHLNPLMRVLDQVALAGREGTKQERMARAKELLAHHGLGPEAHRLFPHELSGGMARRVLLCCALMGNPKLIVADEPTPGLDLELALAALQDFRDFADEGGGVLLITHDIELALRVADRVAVFRRGTVEEETAVENFASPETLSTEYARRLWHALPEHDFASPARGGHCGRGVAHHA